MYVAAIGVSLIVLMMDWLTWKLSCSSIASSMLTLNKRESYLHQQTPLKPLEKAAQRTFSWDCVVRVSISFNIQDVGITYWHLNYWLTDYYHDGLIGSVMGFYKQSLIAGYDVQLCPVVLWINSSFPWGCWWLLSHYICVAAFGVSGPCRHFDWE